MAQKMITQLIDDLDGTQIGVETVTFQLDGADYAMELGLTNAERLRKILRGYAEHARRAGGRRRTAPGRAQRQRTTSTASKTTNRASRGEFQSLVYAPEVREWARENGMSVGAHGRMANRVVEEYLNRVSRKRRRG